jgi:hypothetical protein
MKAFLASILVVVAGMSASAEPRLEISETEFDFGDVPQNVTLVFGFWLKSTGTDTVVIEDVKTGCSCAVMPLEQDRIAPGDSIRALVYWDIERRLGRMGRAVRIFTNADSDPYRIRFDAAGVFFPDSAQPVSIKPYKFILAKSSQVVIDSISFTLVNRVNEDISVSLASPPVNECQIKLPETIPALSTDTGYIKIQPAYADTEFKTSMTLLFSGKQTSRLSVPIERKFYYAKTK